MQTVRTPLITAVMQTITIKTMQTMRTVVIKLQATAITDQYRSPDKSDDADTTVDGYRFAIR